MPVKERRTKECRGSGYHDLPVMDVTVRGVSLSCEAVYFLTAFQLPGSFNSIITRGFSAPRNFSIKRVPRILISTHPIPFLFLSSSRLGF